jgi:transcriptional regulator with XRE-family HTH domain
MRAHAMTAMTSEVMEFCSSPRIMRSVQSITPHAGTLVREWRTSRRLSQLDLALEANVSPRHLSCVETGKSQPSREMISRLADALGMPLRERNALLVSAGFAPKYRHTELTSPEMAPVRRAIEFILQHQEPYPAIVTNRHWDMLLTNDATVRIFSMLRPGGPKHANVLHQIFDPDDMRSVIANWEELAVDIIRHLHNQVAVAPSDTKSRKLLEEVLAYPGVPEGWRTREPGSAPQPLMNTVFGNGEVELRFFSTITTFGTPHDVTLDELRIECMFPADEATAETCRNAEVTAAATSQASRAPARSPGPKPP